MRFLYTQGGHKLRFFKGGRAQFVTVGIIYWEQSLTCKNPNGSKSVCAQARWHPRKLAWSWHTRQPAEQAEYHPLEIDGQLCHPGEQAQQNGCVILAIALSDRWCWVSTPKWVRTSWKVTSTCQQRTNHCKICKGSAEGSVHNRALVSNFPLGPRIDTQRRGMAGIPL